MNDKPQNEAPSCSEPVGSETIASFPNESLPSDFSHRVRLAVALDRQMDAAENEGGQALKD